MIGTEKFSVSTKNESWPWIECKVLKVTWDPAWDKPSAISEKLCDFFKCEHETQMDRTEVTKLLNHYIKKNNLNDLDGFQSDNVNSTTFNDKVGNVLTNWKKKEN